jgi:2-dehydro-3-deoxyphosphogalactonate aldolase
VTLNLAPTPLVAILRGVTPDEADSVAAVIVEAGFGAVEVPLNSPDPLASVELIARLFGDKVLVGAGTVMEAREVDEAAEAGAKLIVAPNADRAVIERAVRLGLVVLPGVGTPTEAFAALRAGASGLKLFPGEAIPPEVVRAWRSVLPKETLLYPVGGVTPERIGPYRRAGASGFGIGGALYKPGASVGEVARAAQAFVKAWWETA